MTSDHKALCDRLRGQGSIPSRSEVADAIEAIVARLTEERDAVQAVTIERCAKAYLASIFWPLDLEGYETAETRRASHAKVQSSALSSFPGAGGDVLTALSMLALQQQRVIDGAKSRYQRVARDDLRKIATIPPHVAAARVLLAAHEAASAKPVSARSHAERAMANLGRNRLRAIATQGEPT